MLIIFHNSIVFNPNILNGSVQNIWKVLVISGCGDVLTVCGEKGSWAESGEEAMTKTSSVPSSNSVRPLENCSRAAFSDTSHAPFTEDPSEHKAEHMAWHIYTLNTSGSHAYTHLTSVFYFY